MPSSPDIDQTTKKPTALGWLFLLQINDLPEFDVERAMGIESAKLTIAQAQFPLFLRGTFLVNPCIPIQWGQQETLTAASTSQM